MLYSRGLHPAVFLFLFYVVSVVTQRQLSVLLSKEVSPFLSWLASTLFHCQNNDNIGCVCLLLSLVQESGCIRHMACLQLDRKCIHTAGVCVCVCLDVFDLVLFHRFG